MTSKLDIKFDEDPMKNHMNLTEELNKLLEFHKIKPDGVWMFGAQLQWMARNYIDSMAMDEMKKDIRMTVNKMFDPKAKTYVEMRKEQIAKEVKEGKKRVKPGEK